MHVTPNLVSATQPATGKIAPPPVAGQSFGKILHQVSNTKTESGAGAHHASNSSSKRDEADNKSVAHDKDASGGVEVQAAPVSVNEHPASLPILATLQFGFTQNVAADAPADDSTAAVEAGATGSQATLWAHGPASTDTKGTAHLERGASDAFAGKQGLTFGTGATVKTDAKSGSGVIEAASAASPASLKPLQPIMPDGTVDDTKKADAQADADSTDAAPIKAVSTDAAVAVSQQIASMGQNVLPAAPQIQAQQPAMPTVSPVAGTNKSAAPKATTANPLSKIDVSRQTAGTTKDRAAAGDVRSKRSEDEADGEQGSESSQRSDSSFAAKVSEAMSSAVAHPAVQAATHVDANASAQASAFHMQGAKDLQQDASTVSSPAPQVAAPMTGGVADNKPAVGISSAQLLQSVNQSEMKLGMHSAEFGNISISTSVNHQTLSAQISTEHTELGRALAAHLPAIEEKLGSAYGVQAKVELRDSSTMQQHDGTADQQAGQSRSGSHRNLSSGSASSMNASSAVVVQNAWSSADSSRLDIRI